MSTLARGTLPRYARRRVVGAACLLLLVVVLVAASLLFGSHDLTPSQVRYGLTHDYTRTGTPRDATLNDAAIIVRTLRVPRTVLAICAGVALAVAGAITQGHTRNPIADPGLLGVTAGASLSVAVCTSLFGVAAILPSVVFSMVGGALTALLVFGLWSIGPGRGNPLTLVLLGAGVSSFFAAFTATLVLADRETMNAMRRWSVGSVAGVGFDVIAVVAPFMLVGLLLAVMGAPTLNILNLGDDIARGLGINITRARVLGLLSLTLLVGATTAACGPIALLGLMAPHLARAITGPDYRWLIPYSGLIGAALLLLCDVVGRLIATDEVAASIVVALIGAPFFVLVVRYKRMAQV